MLQRVGSDEKFQWRLLKIEWARYNERQTRRIEVVLETEKRSDSLIFCVLPAIAAADPGAGNGVT